MPVSAYFDALETETEEEGGLISSGRKIRKNGPTAYLQRCIDRCLGTPARKLVGKWAQKKFSGESSFDADLVESLWDEYAGNSKHIGTDALAMLVSDCTEALVMEHAREVLAVVMEDQMQSPETCAKGMEEAFGGVQGASVTKNMFKAGLALALTGLLPTYGGKGGAGGGAHAPLVSAINKKEFRELMSGIDGDSVIDHPMVSASSTPTLDRFVTADEGTDEAFEQFFQKKKTVLQRFETLQGPLLDRASELREAKAPDPTSTEPICTKQLVGASIEQIREALASEEKHLDLVSKVLEVNVNAKDFKASKWKDGIRIKNSKIRGVSFKMPPPADIPSAIAKLQSIPDELSASTVFRMCSSDEDVVLLEQTSIPQVPLGENFEVLAIHSFRPFGGEDGYCGLNYYKWVIVVWVKEPSWTMKWIKGIVESQTIEKASKTGEIFIQKMQESLNL